MTNEKDITITYDSFDDLVEREPKMVQTLQNYLRKNPEYVHTGSEVLYTDNGKFKLVLKVETTS